MSAQLQPISAAAQDLVAQLLHKENSSEPRPGARLDSCEALVGRAERRVEAAREAVATAEQALEEARRHKV